MSKIRAEEWGGETWDKATHWWSKYWKLSDVDIKRTMINMSKIKIKWQVKNYTGELGPVLKRKRKGKNQIKIVNLKNTIARTDSLWHDEEVDKSSPHKATIKPVRTVKYNHFSILKIPAYNKQKENSGELSLSSSTLAWGPSRHPPSPCPAVRHFIQGITNCEKQQLRCHCHGSSLDMKQCCSRWWSQLQANRDSVSTSPRKQLFETSHRQGVPEVKTAKTGLKNFPRSLGLTRGWAHTSQRLMCNTQTHSQQTESEYLHDMSEEKTWVPVEVKTRADLKIPWTRMDFPGHTQLCS